MYSRTKLSLLEDAVRLGLSYPDGLISMYRPFGGTRHDGAMLLAARILIILARFRSSEQDEMVLIESAGSNEPGGPRNVAVQQNPFFFSTKS